ncbi:DUF3575 domain-containing protein [Dyadobacter aurulentus]|uniref:DUF3575 domain-containing protein n=1 Tax=Dyadobacter sp. UC 10 TaxID=2605428 RepID=UPI0011F0AE72|nr:DUF3575 domain-containing protein [Dyadobacter sp. UC 10]KAA0992194.1 DUF3575 domain-containing protein [Dyadobacter sp. UC 10]
MKNFSFFLMALCCSATSFGQTQKPVYKPNADIHFMPIALAFPDPSVRIGSELMTGGRWSYGLSVGAGMKAFTFSRTPLSLFSSRSYRMMEIRPEVKFYWLKRETLGWYLAAEGFVSSVNRQLGKDSYYLSDTTMVSFDGSHFSKKKMGLVWKIGVKFLVPEKLTIDMYTGLGLARTNVRYTKTENPTEDPYDPFFDPEDFYPGKKFTPVISFGVKFGLLVWQKEE